LQNVLLQIGSALAVLAVSFELELPDASDEVFGRHVVQVGSVRGHGGGGTEREQTDGARDGRVQMGRVEMERAQRCAGGDKQGRSIEESKGHFWAGGLGGSTWSVPARGFFDFVGGVEFGQ
jgi:hypothetical protein